MTESILKKKSKVEPNDPITTLKSVYQTFACYKSTLCSSLGAFHLKNLELSRSGLEVNLQKLWEEPTQRVVVLQGLSGSGKTTLFKSLAMGWANGELWKDKFTAVVYVSLYEESGVSLDKALELGSSVEESDALASWCKMNKGQFLWLLDGWEKPKVKDGWLQHLTQNTIDYVMVGCQTGCTFKSDMLIETLGLSGQGREQFLRKHFNEWDSLEMATLTLAALRRCGRAMYEPGIALISRPILEHREQQSENGRAVRLLLRDFWLRDAFQRPKMMHLLCRAVEEIGSSASRTQVFESAVDAIAKHCGLDRSHLQQLAFSHLSDDVDVFSESDLKMMSGNECYLFERNACSNDVRWSHLAFRDFLAAEYVCKTLAQEHVTQVLLSFKDDCGPFFCFVIGIGENSRASMSRWYDNLEDNSSVAGSLFDPRYVDWMSEDRSGTIELFLKDHWKKTLCSSLGDAVLMSAIDAGSLRAVRFLLGEGVNIHTVQKEIGLTPLLCAAMNGHVNVVKLLLESGADLNCRNRLGETVLHLAASSGDVDTVEVAIEAGANVMSLDKRGKSALHCAVENGHLDVVRVLVESGADVNCIDKTNKTPVYYARNNGRTGITKHLTSNQ